MRSVGVSYRAESLMTSCTTQTISMTSFQLWIDGSSRSRFLPLFIGQQTSSFSQQRKNMHNCQKELVMHRSVSFPMYKFRDIKQVVSVTKYKVKLGFWLKFHCSFYFRRYQKTLNLISVSMRERNCLPFLHGCYFKTADRLCVWYIYFQIK